MTMTYFLISFLSMAAIALVTLIIAMRESDKAERERRVTKHLAKINEALLNENMKLRAERNLRVATEYNEGGKKK